MTMDDEDARPRTSLLATPLLDGLGVAELTAYIAGLKAEIARADAEITRKQGLRAAADNVFKM